MGNTTTYGDINQRTAAYASREMLRHAEPKIILAKMGKTKPIPTNAAKTVKFRRPKPFPVSTVPLAEGVTPTPQKLQYEDVEATLKQYGNVVEISDVVLDTGEDPVLNDAATLTGEQAGATSEQIVYAAVKGGTNVFYANGANRAAVNTAISLNKQRAVTRQLNAQKARKITKILAGSPDYATSPVEAAFIAVTHTDVEADIRNMAGFVPTSKYGDRRLVSEHEIGMVENVRYVLSEDLAPYLDAGGAPSTTVVSNLGSAADVYPVLFFGEDAFGVVPLKGKNAMTPMVVNPKPSAPSLSPRFRRDPMNNIKFGTMDGTGAAIDIDLGWAPARVRVVNIESNTIEELEWFAGMANASAIKTVTGTVSRTKITSNGITPLSGGMLGFRIGADTDVNVAGETIVWIAERTGLGGGV